MRLPQVRRCNCIGVGGRIAPSVCGGAERLGAVVDAGPLQSIDSERVAMLLDAVRAHGVVVVKGQNLTRADQVQLTDKLGDTVVLPKSFF